MPSDDGKLRFLLSPSVIEAERRRRRAPFVSLFPDSGPLARVFYPKHIEFFEAGARYKERLFMAANRVGKTVAGAYEATCHLTGRYPFWWKGRRFDKATDGWACGTNSQTTRDVVQGVLLGRTTGDGMIPAEAIRHTVAGRGITGSIETVWVQHASGKTSKLGFKTYEQGRRSFEGEAKDFVWCDEEPPMDIYTEILYRLLTTKGLAWTTFTPLLGMSEVVMSFLEPENDQSSLSKYVVQAGWKDVPHGVLSIRSMKLRSPSQIALFRIPGRERSEWTWVGTGPQPSGAPVIQAQERSTCTANTTRPWANLPPTLLQSAAAARGFRE